MASAKIETTVVDPKEQDKQRKSVLAAEQAPTTAEITPGSNLWQQTSQTLGPPFDSERVTLAQLRQIRKDPMIAFGSHYLKVPLARAEWHIDARDRNGPNPQVAAFVDSCLRKIYARFILQRELCKDFGYQAMVKRFIFENPGGLFIDPTETDPTKAQKPAWDEGDVLPIIWKVPTALRPETVQPNFDEKTGEFTGIAYTAPQGFGTGKTTGLSGKSNGAGGAAQGIKEIDIYHAYWAVNMRDDEHGSFYGYPRIGFARDYWWAYKFLFMMSNRAFERLAIPPILAYHPEGSTLVDAETGTMRPNVEIALEAAERLRANAVAAVPSSMAQAGLDASTTMREWDFKFMETPYESLSIFNERFNYINVMKLRSVWVPELAFIGGNGTGGNSAGNIAEQMADVMLSSQALDMDDIDEDINRLWIPQLLAINFPDFINNGGVARKVSHGFRSEDVDFYKQIIQLIGQVHPEMLAQVDLVEIFRRINTPLKSPQALETEREALVQQAVNGQPPAVTPTANGIGVIKNPTANPGVTNGGSSPISATVGNANGSALGFEDSMVYVAGPEHIDLSEAMDFVAGLPSSGHYDDKTVRALMLQLRKLWLGYYRSLFPDFAAYISTAKLELADVGLEEDEVYEGTLLYAMFANGSSKQDSARKITSRAATKAANALLKKWGASSETLNTLRDRSRGVLQKIVNRQMAIGLRDTGLKTNVDDAITGDINSWVDEQVGRLIKMTQSTIKDELRAFIADQIREGRTSTEIADEVRAHFTGFEGHKADRVARSETRDVVNAGNLFAAKSAGLRYVRASDGENFDPDCAKRNGKLFTITEAFKELRKEHPYGTLGFNPIVRANFSIEHVAAMPDNAPDGVAAYFDSDKDTAYMLLSANTDDKDAWLERLGAALCA